MDTFTEPANSVPLMVAALALTTTEPRYAVLRTAPPASMENAPLADSVRRAALEDSVPCMSTLPRAESVQPSGFAHSSAPDASTTKLLTAASKPSEREDWIKHVLEQSPASQKKDDPSPQGSAEGETLSDPHADAESESGAVMHAVAVAVGAFDGDAVMHALPDALTDCDRDSDAVLRTVVTAEAVALAVEYRYGSVVGSGTLAAQNKPLKSQSHRERTALVPTSAVASASRMKALDPTAAGGSSRSR